MPILQALGFTLVDVNSWLLSDKHVPASSILSNNEIFQLMTDPIKEDQESCIENLIRSSKQYQ